MTPKEKAKELVDKFYDDRLRASASGKIKNAKYLALICVDEILDTLNQLTLEFEYWEEVKQEIAR